MTKEIVSKIKSLYQKSKQLKTENNELKKQLNYSISSSSIPPAPSSDEGMDLADISISSASSSSIPTSHNKSISSSTMKQKIIELLKFQHHLLLLLLFIKDPLL